MAVVNSKDPGILEEFENSFGQAPKISRDEYVSSNFRQFIASSLG